MTEDQAVPLKPLTRPQLIQLLAEIGNALHERVESIVVGRTSLVLQGIKPATSVVDLVFLSDEQFKCCVDSLKSLGYRFQTSGRWVRLVKEASIDLFLNRVLLISAYMLERAGKLEVDTGGLLARLLIPQDVFLMSSLSGHPRDLDDMKTVVEKATVDWDVLLYEVKERMTIGSSRRVPLSLAYSLERLKESGMRIPSLVQERLLEMLIQQSPIRT